MAFDSEAAGLVDEDSNLASDIFIRDQDRGTTIRASVASDGSQAIGPTAAAGTPDVFSRGYAQPGRDRLLAYDPSISADGRFVAFTSHAVNLMLGDTNASTDVFVHDRKTGDTERVSVSSAGEQGMVLCPQCGPPLSVPDSFYPSISADGRFVSFSSYADNLVPDDTNGMADVFVHDRDAGRTERVSVDSKGDQIGMDCKDLICRNETLAGSPQWQPRSSISGNGRFVAFDTDASDLVAGDTNAMADTFVHDRKTGKVERVSVSSNGDEAVDERVYYLESWLCGSGLGKAPYGSSAQRTISHDGRFVTFWSTASNLVPNDTNTETLAWRATHLDGVDIYVHDRQTGRTERVNVSSTGGEEHTRDGTDVIGRSGSAHPSISPDGRFVSWTADTDGNLSAGPQSNSGLYVHDRQTGATTYVSTRPDPDEAFSGSLTIGELSNDGRFFVFSSVDRHAERDDTNPGQDIYLRDMGSVLGVGGFFRSEGATLDRYAPDAVGEIKHALVDKGADINSVSVVYRPAFSDLFVTEELVTMPRLRSAPGAATSSLLFGVDLVVGGSSYQVRAQGLPSSSASTRAEATFGLFRCDGQSGPCTKVANLRGGYGTTGDEIVISIPLSVIGGDLPVWDATVAWTALGSYTTGPLQTIDVLRVHVSRQDPSL